MSDKEVEVNGKTYGEGTRVTLSVSTLAWIIGGLLSVITTLATVGYFDIKSDVKEQKEVFDNEKTQYKEEIKDILQEEMKYEREKREDIREDIGEIKGDIKVILEKTRNLENGGSGTHSIHNTSGPDNSMPPPPVHH
jgi:hypothetical protein